MELLKAENIRKSFDGTEVLKDISVTVHENEVVSIIGPSGSGKSTLLRCMTFLETPDGGEISYCGEKALTSSSGKPHYASKHDMKRIKGYFSLVFQNFNLFPHRSVMENIIDAPIKVQGRNKEEVYAEAKALLDKIGLSDKGDAYPCQLSGGQQQRVAIARSLAMKPRMLFFDEPTSALDPELTSEILKILRTIASEKMTMVIVTHEIGFARNISDRVIFMSDGVIVEEGAPDKVIDNPENERTQMFLKKMAEKD